MTVKNPIQYISRTFLSIYNDINSDPELVDKPDWFKRIIAGVGDMLDINANAIANQSFLRTAFTRQAVADLCALIDYQLTPHATSSNDLIFYVRRGATLPLSLTASVLNALSQGSVSIVSKRFESRTAKTFTSMTEGFTANSTTDRLTIATYTYRTGDLVRLSTTGTLPSATGGGLSTGTDYWVIRYSATEIYLARTLADAYNGVYIDLTSTGSGSHTIQLWSFSIVCYQQKTITSVNVGLSDGVTQFQKFDLPDNFILRDTITLSINSLTWTRVDNLVNSSSTDRHFRLLYKADGGSSIQFGNGVYGLIPPAFNIFATYSYGGGADSNISVLDRINIYSGGHADVSAVSNPVTFTGGTDEEGIELAKINAPMLLKARDRFVTIDDGEYLTLHYGGVSICKINPNVYGLLSCQVVCVPNGGGTMGSGDKTALQNYLISRSILESIDVRVDDPSYSSINVTTAAKILAGFTYSAVEPFFKLAWRLIFSEITQEIINDYIQNGIASAVVIINAKWSYSFTVADYPQIQLLLDNVEPSYFGKTFQESECLGFVNVYVNGIDYLTTTLSFPVTTTTNQITQAGTIMATEIT